MFMTPLRKNRCIAHGLSSLSLIFLWIMTWIRCVRNVYGWTAPLPQGLAL